MHDLDIYLWTYHLNCTINHIIDTMDMVMCQVNARLQCNYIDIIDTYVC